MKNQIHRVYGLSAEDWISRLPSELEIDAVGLWQITPVGRTSFGFSGEDLRDFVYNCLMALFSRGAVPVVPSSKPNKDWELVEKYGDNAEKMAAAIIDEWMASSIDPHPSDSLWFALPENF